MGILLIKGQKPKAIMAMGAKLKKVMCKGEQIWSRGVKITFVEGSARTTVEYEEGATVSRSSSLAGATFVGWSTSASGSSPVKTFTASQDMTVYRVVKFNDYIVMSKTVYDDVMRSYGTYTVDAPSKYDALWAVTKSNMNGYLKDSAGTKFLTYSANSTTGTVYAYSPFVVYAKKDFENAADGTLTIWAKGGTRIA